MEIHGKILIADDDPEIRNVLRMLLEEEGYQVISAENGEEVLKKADDTIDLFILDVNMPVMSGFAAGTELRKQTYAPMIFLTAYSGESDKAIGYSAGADDYIVKPFSNAELLFRVKALLRRANITVLSAALYPPENRKRRRSARADPVSGSGPGYGQPVRKPGRRNDRPYRNGFRILELLLTHRKKIYSLETFIKACGKKKR